MLELFIKLHTVDSHACCDTNWRVKTLILNMVKNPERCDRQRMKQTNKQNGHSFCPPFFPVSPMLLLLLFSLNLLICYWGSLTPLHLRTGIQHSGTIGSAQKWNNCTCKMYKNIKYSNIDTYDVSRNTLMLLDNPAELLAMNMTLKPVIY